LPQRKKGKGKREKDLEQRGTHGWAVSLGEKLGWSIVYLSSWAGGTIDIDKGEKEGGGGKEGGKGGLGTASNFVQKVRTVCK